mmetsp:Transcript_30664/g.41994  ORF Transcript_30664/g.41994 Transcript_30664/m.41994 type:complete len:320 (+) Transcript_30664:99-1058(+)
MNSIQNSLLYFGRMHEHTQPNCSAISTEDAVSCLLAAASSTFKFDAPKYYEKMSGDFGRYHENPWNVLIHFITTPIGLVGALSLLRYYTRSSSSLLALSSVYLLSLLPIVPNGTFAGTMLLCGIIVFLARKLKLNVIWSVVFIVVGYGLQDLAHICTGEKTYQSTYSAGGAIDLNNPFQWAGLLMEHSYYLLPLCIHVAMPFLSPLVPAEVMSVLDAPLPTQMQQLHAFAWLLGPLIVFAFGSYCLDSKNSFCFFTGTPYFRRVLRCSLLLSEENITKYSSKGDKDSSPSHESRQNDLRTVRDWAIAHNPTRMHDFSLL